MKWSRRFRKTLTLGCLRLGQKLAQRGDANTVEAMGKGLWILTKTALPLRKRLEKNMRLTGMYREGLLDAHFERAIDQMIMLGYALQGGLHNIRKCLEKFQFDDSFGLLEQAYAKGKGVIIIAPHICGYPIYGGVVSSRIPCVIYVGHNFRLTGFDTKDPRKMRITEAVAKAGNTELVYPPHGATKAQRLQVAINVLRQGKVMFLTPDTPRKLDEGVPVSIFGQTVHLPTGVFVMSLRTGAPVVATWWHWEDGIYHIRYGEPIELQRGGNLRAKAEVAMQRWGADVDAFVREHPDMWWNWLNKRWTQIIRNGSLAK